MSTLFSMNITRVDLRQQPKVSRLIKIIERLFSMLSEVKHILNCKKTFAFATKHALLYANVGIEV